jgi:hypothetical protein
MIVVTFSLALSATALRPAAKRSIMGVPLGVAVIASRGDRLCIRIVRQRYAERKSSVRRRSAWRLTSRETAGVSSRVDNRSALQRLGRSAQRG